MSIKRFDFPTFDEWNETYEFAQKIGDYTCMIAVLNWGPDGQTHLFQAAIANSNNPLSVYKHKIYSNHIRCNTSSNELLKEWYESVIKKLNHHWESYIIQNYISV